jgi:hypothetical protein
VIELYAITHAAAPPPPARLRALTADGLAAVVGPVSDEQVTADALWRHEQVVEELMADRDVLPVRYGTRFSCDEDAAEAVGARRTELAAALDRVRGAIELSVRALSARPAPIHESLRSLARDARVRPAQGSDDVLRAAYLVDRAAVDAFVARVARLQAAQPGAQILCTGPWPPYGFSDS